MLLLSQKTSMWFDNDNVRGPLVLAYLYKLTLEQIQKLNLPWSQPLRVG